VDQAARAGNRWLRRRDRISPANSDAAPRRWNLRQWSLDVYGGSDYLANHCVFVLDVDYGSIEDVLEP
jgi:hypothetical protein